MEYLDVGIGVYLLTIQRVGFAKITFTLFRLANSQTDGVGFSQPSHTLHL